jgi:hypothetical protein
MLHGEAAIASSSDVYTWILREYPAAFGAFSLAMNTLSK